MAAEKNFENKVKRFLEEQGIYPFGIEKQKMKQKPIGYYEKRWGGGQFTKSGLPDMHIVVLGTSLEVELKAPNGKPSPLQIKYLKQIDDAKGNAILLYPDDFETFKDMILPMSLGHPYHQYYKKLKGRWEDWLYLIQE